MEDTLWTSGFHSQTWPLWCLGRNAGINQSTEARPHCLAQYCKKWARGTRACPTKWSNQASDSHQTQTACTGRSGQLLWTLHELLLNQGAIIAATWKTLSGPAALIHNLAPLAPWAQCWDKPEHRSSKSAWSSPITLLWFFGQQNCVSQECFKSIP